MNETGGGHGVDEEKLGELFAAAACDAPPPSFDAADVAYASRRLSARRRALLTSASGVAIVLVAAGLFLGLAPFVHNSGGMSGASAGAARLAAPSESMRTFGSNLVPGHAGRPDSAAPNFPGTPPLQGGGVSGGVGPAADSTPQGCGPADGELAVALARELPSAGADPVDPKNAQRAGLTCPSGSRSVGFAVRAGTATGRVVALVTPAGVDTSAHGLPSGSGTARHGTSGGRTVVVVAVPGAGSASAPLAGSLPSLAATLAASQ